MPSKLLLHCDMTIFHWCLSSKNPALYLIPEACCSSPIIPNKYLLSSYCYTFFWSTISWPLNQIDWLRHTKQRERRNGCWGTVTSRGCAHQKPLFYQLWRGYWNGHYRNISIQKWRDLFKPSPIPTCGMCHDASCYLQPMAIQSQLPLRVVVEHRSPFLDW